MLSNNQTRYYGIGYIFKYKGDFTGEVGTNPKFDSRILYCTDSAIFWVKENKGLKKNTGKAVEISTYIDLNDIINVELMDVKEMLNGIQEVIIVHTKIKKNKTYMMFVPEKWQLHFWYSCIQRLVEKKNKSPHVYHISSKAYYIPNGMNPEIFGLKKEDILCENPVDEVQYD